MLSLISILSPGTEGLDAPPAPQGGRRRPCRAGSPNWRAALDLRLFERGARALKLTEEGRALFERAGRLLTELEETAAAIASGGERPRGRLRISAPLLFSQTAMGKIAAGFALKYPEVRLEVSTEDRAVDMIEEGFDLVIRVSPDPDDSLVGRPFLRDRLVAVASPRLARPAGRPHRACRRALGRRSTGLEREDARRPRNHRDRAGPRAVIAHHGPRCGARRRRRRPPPRVARKSRFGRRLAGTLGRYRGAATLPCGRSTHRGGC